MYDLITNLWNIISTIDTRNDRPMLDYNLTDSANPKNIPEWANRLLRYLGDYAMPRSTRDPDKLVTLLLGREQYRMREQWMGTKELWKIRDNVVCQLHHLNT